MPLCSGGVPNIQVDELFVSGNLEFDDRTETRVKEFIIYCKNGALGEHLQPANLYAENNIVITTLEINNYWSERSTTGPNTVQGSPLLARQVTLSQLTDEAVRATVVYSTDVSAWALKKRFEISSVSEKLMVDLDASLGSTGGSCQDPVNCTCYSQLPNPREGDALPNGETGLETLVPKTVMVIEGLRYLTPVDLIDMRNSVGTMNQLAFGPFDGASEEWLFLGFDGEEVRKNGVDVNLGSVYDLKMRFAHDIGRHRLKWVRFNDGNLGGTIQYHPNGFPVCREVRLYRVTNWQSWYPVPEF